MVQRLAYYPVVQEAAGLLQNVATDLKIKNKGILSIKAINLLGNLSRAISLNVV
jgi:hypothetical protein